MKQRTRLLPACIVLTALLTSQTPVLANCESGAYLIHTEAEYADLDNTRAWLFRYELDGHRLELMPSASTSESSIVRLVAFLRGPDRQQLRIRRGGTTCQLAPDQKIELWRKPEIMDQWAAGLVLCPELGDKSHANEKGLVLFDRDTKSLVLPEPLEVHPATTEWSSAEAAGTSTEGTSTEGTSAEGSTAEGSTAEAAGTSAGTCTSAGTSWQERLSRLDLRASNTTSRAITPDDVAATTVFRIQIGEAAHGFAVVIANLRLFHLETLFETDGYLQAPALAGAQAELPVLFLDKGRGDELLYFGDGRWCSTYRLSLQSQGMEGPFLGALERFSITAAYDLDGDGRPELLRVNDAVVYRLGGPNALEVVDWGVGC